MSSGAWEPIVGRRQVPAGYRIAEAELAECCRSALHESREHLARTEAAPQAIIAFECGKCHTKYRYVSADVINRRHADAMASWMREYGRKPARMRWEALGTGRAATTEELPTCCKRSGYDQCVEGERNDLGGPLSFECSECGTPWVWQAGHESPLARAAAEATDPEAAGVYRRARELQRQGEIVAAILEERRRQDAKWGEQNHDDLTWLAIFVEEVGEVAKAAIPAGVGGHIDDAEIEEELRHAVAVGLAWLECRARRREGRASGGIVPPSTEPPRRPPSGDPSSPGTPPRPAAPGAAEQVVGRGRERERQGKPPLPFNSKSYDVPGEGNMP